MKSRKGIVWVAILIVLALVVFFNRGRIRFDWAVFFQQLRHIKDNDLLAAELYNMILIQFR